MTIFGVLAVILGIVAGILTRNIFVGIAFPILLVIFSVMWRLLGPEKKIGDVVKEEIGKVVPIPTIENKVPEQSVDSKEESK